ncbi:hypothetical protein B0I35DRAFT_395882 [Stachybotrys elegans]|uniref:Rhodopsin domain-containing protein n=1 Tax=Stachybotrys elegans TaxID=80388 RepID=A0A8K0SKT3_9HYPO|nr:hypothetical protein B0I35DRAFT_395882 [Stachybotrys elegans]
MENAAFDPFTTPLGPPPAGEEPDFENGPSQAWQPRVAIYGSLPLMVVCVVLRNYARFRLMHEFRADDYMMVIAALCSVAFCATMLPYVLKDELGRHYWDFPIAANTIWVDQMSAAITSLYCISSATMKIAICSFYNRMFSASFWSRVMIRGGIALTAVTYTILLVVWLVYAVPRPGEHWRSPEFILRITDSNAIITTTQSCISTVLDFYILSIPLITIARLKAATNRKIMISIVFLAGLLACCFSAAGIAYRLEIYRAISSGVPEYRWTSMPAYALAVAEINIGLMCACVPVMFPLGKGVISGSRLIWTSLKESLLQRSTARLRSEGENSDTSAMHGELPKVPPGAFTRLWTLLLSTRDVQSEAPPHTNPEHIELGEAPYSELRSVDIDYHSHLKRKSGGMQYTEREATSINSAATGR